MKKKLIFFLMLLFMLSCRQQQKPTISFYYWKTVFALTEMEARALSQNKASKIYIRYFDIDLKKETNEPFPRIPIVFHEKPKFEVVPVIYIKNGVMLRKAVNMPDLAKKAILFIDQINRTNDISCNEIQIDCDWTLDSRDQYFKFLEAFKKGSGKRLSATIRLHQVKHFKKTGVPNVDRGVLMYYNMGTIAPDSLNSIYDHKIARRYLKSLNHYPKRIDVALPVFSWAVHIREGKVIGLRSKIDFADYAKNPNFNAKGNTIAVNRSNYRQGTFYKRGDWLKIEKVTSADLRRIADDLDRNLKETPQEIIFYDLDERNLKNYETNIFRQAADFF